MFDIKFEWDKRNKRKINIQLENMAKKFIPLAEDSLEKTILDIVKFAKAEQFPSSFRNWTWNLRNSIGATKDELIPVKDAGAATITIDGVRYLARAMSGKKRVKKIGKGILEGKFIVPMFYSPPVEDKYMFANKAVHLNYKNFKKHQKDNIEKFKKENRIR